MPNCLAGSDGVETEYLRSDCGVSGSRDATKHVVFSLSRVSAHAELGLIQLRFSNWLVESYDPVQGKSR